MCARLPFRTGHPCDGKKHPRTCEPHVKKYAADIPDGQLIVNVAKGVEADTLMTMSQIIEEEVPGANVVVLSDRATQRKSAAACRPRSLSARMTARAHCMCRMCS